MIDCRNGPAAPLSPAKTLIKRLRAGGAAVLERNGRWHVMSPDGSGQRALPLKSSPVIAALIAGGALAQGDDGLFRPVTQAVRAVRNMAESPLQRLGNLDAALLRAADRLRNDYERAHLSQRLTASYDPSASTGSRHWQMSDNGMARLNDGALAARERLHLALEAVGPELSGLLLHVCCMTAGLEEAERLLDLPKRSARAVLVLGLTRLARHYGLKPQLKHGGPSRIGHWAVADFRPHIPTAGARRPEAP